MTRARPLVYRTVPRSVFLVGFVASFVSIRLGLSVPWFALLIVALAACALTLVRSVKVDDTGVTVSQLGHHRFLDWKSIAAVTWSAESGIDIVACVFGEETPTRIVGRGTRFLPNWNKRAVDGYLADVREVAPAQFRDRFLTVASQQTNGGTPAAVLLGRSASQWWADDPRAHQRSTGETG